jgi:hypothetical protein
MNQYTASNGVEIEIRSTGTELIITGARALHLSAERTTALREFFRAEEDERLGRWRWPEHPTWTCYLTRLDEVLVFNEAAPAYGSFLLGRGADTWPYARPAADAFFDAHPHPKPWHNAMPGEMWALTVDGEPEVPAVASSSSSGHVVFTAATNEAGGTEELWLDTFPARITAGRRIWPEDDS